MPPKDPSPLGDEMANRMPEPKFPEPNQKDESGSASSGTHADVARPSHSEIRQRPAVPEHPERTAADVEDEDADPVIDSGPGIDDGPKGPSKQRG